MATEFSLALWKIKTLPLPFCFLKWGNVGARFLCQGATEAPEAIGATGTKRGDRGNRKGA
jgi:hypothetical protein